MVARRDIAGAVVDICIYHRTESVGNAQCTDVEFWGVNLSHRAPHVSLEPYPSRSGDYSIDQSVGIVECEFSVEFCCRHGHHGDCLMDATTYEIEEWME